MSLLGKESAANAGNSGNASAIGSAAELLLGNVDVGDLLGSLLGTGETGSTGKKKKKKKSDGSAENLLGSLLGKLFK